MISVLDKDFLRKYERKIHKTGAQVTSARLKFCSPLPKTHLNEAPREREKKVDKLFATQSRLLSNRP